jgi:hypothetical protein
LSPSRGKRLLFNFPGKEPWSVALAVKTKEEVEARTALLAEWSERMQGLAPVESIISILRDGGRARTEKRLAEVRDAVEVVAAGLASTKTSALAPSWAAMPPGPERSFLYDRTPRSSRMKYR